MHAWLYFMDEFKPINIQLNKLPKYNIEGLETLVKLNNTVKELVEEKYKVKILGIKPSKFFKDDKEVLFEYTAMLENGQLSIKIMFTENPRELLYKFYEWERGE